MSSIDAVGSNFLELKWKFGEYFIGQNIKRNGILPDPEFFKTSMAFRAMLPESLEKAYFIPNTGSGRFASAGSTKAYVIAPSELSKILFTFPESSDPQWRPTEHSP